MLQFIETLVVGLIVGLLARALKPGDDKMGILMTIVLGIVGSLLAGYVGRAAGWYAPGQGAGWIASIIGAILCAALWAPLGATMAMILGASVILAIRLLAAHYHWSLPKA